MTGQEIKASIAQALEEAKRRFSAERAADPDTETTPPSFRVGKNGIGVYYKKTAGRNRRAIVDQQGVQRGWIVPGGYLVSCSVTYKWEILLP